MKSRSQKYHYLDTIVHSLSIDIGKRMVYNGVYERGDNSIDSGDKSRVCDVSEWAGKR